MRREPGSFLDECVETVKWFPVLIAFVVALTFACILLVKIGVWIVTWQP